MKSLLLTTLLIGTAAVIASPVQVQQGPARVYRPQRYSLREGVTIANKYCTYPLQFTLTKPVNERGEVFAMNLVGKKNCNFVGGFFSLTVNGYKMSELDFTKEKITRWQDGDCSGMELKLNFDGAKFTLRLFMRPDSPVLWGSLIYDKNSIDPIRKATIDIQALPSMLKIVNRKVLFSNAYTRELVTPAKKYSHNNKWVNLTPADTSFIFQDGELDGSAESKGSGPCWFWIDQTNLARSQAFVRDSWKIFLKFDLKKDCQVVNFGLWHPAARISNTEMAEKLKKEPAAFTFK